MAFDRSRSFESKLKAVARRNARRDKRAAQFAALAAEPRKVEPRAPRKGGR